MVVGLYRAGNEAVTRSPRTVEEFEEMMKESVRMGKKYVSPYVKKKPSDCKIVTYDPNVSPFTPYYEPQKRGLKCAQIEPARVLGKKAEEEPKQLLVVAGAGGVPPGGGGGGGDKDPFKNNSYDLAKFSEASNWLRNNASIDLYNQNTKF